MIKYGIKRRGHGEHIKGDKNPMHKESVKNKIRESKKHHYGLTCNCFICKHKRGEEIQHKKTCPCLKCRIKRKETMGEKNPMYGKGFKGTDNPMYGYVFSKEQIEKKRIAASGKNNPMYGTTGEKSPNWRGGISTLPWGKEFTRELKDKIRNRDNYTCQICGDKETKRRHAVHHIDYDKENNNPENLITLCTACHCRTGYKRKHWMSFFKEMVHA